MDDPSLLLMLSNLLHLHTYLDPISSLLPGSASPPPSSSSASSPGASSISTLTSSSTSAAAPLLFFAIASVLSYASSDLRPRRHSRRRRRRSSSSPSPPSRSVPSPSSSFYLLSSDRALSMDSASRDARFRSLYGVSQPIFDTLLKNLRHLDATALPSSLPLDRALSIALARLSRGLSSRSLARSLSLPPALVSRCTHALTRLLSTRLYPRYVTLPATLDHLLSTLQSFKDLTALPNLAAAIASSPVRLRLRQPPQPHLHPSYPNSIPGPGVDSLRSSSRPFPSILLQAVADHRKVFWDACVRAPGSSDPASHLRDSSLYRRLREDDGVSTLPFMDHVDSIRGHHVRPYLVGDSSFPLLPFLLTPFSSTPSSSAATSGAHEAFDSALAKGRAASVEAAIALLKGRWKILRNLNVGLDHAAQTVVACVVLHNMCQFAKEPEDEGRYMWRDPPESPQPASLVESERSLYYLGESLRQALAEDLYERQQKLDSGAR